MDALEYFKIKKRMTNKCEMDCDKCLLDRKIIEWEKKHPIISNMDKYKEVIKEKIIKQKTKMPTLASTYPNIQIVILLAPPLSGIKGFPPHQLSLLSLA